MAEEADIENWIKDNQFFEEGMAFAEAIIKKFEECYTL